MKKLIQVEAEYLAIQQELNKVYDQVFKDISEFINKLDADNCGQVIDILYELFTAVPFEVKDDPSIKEYILTLKIIKETNVLVEREKANYFFRTAVAMGQNFLNQSYLTEVLQELYENVVGVSE